MIDWPLDLLDAVSRRKAVLVIGSGISRNSTGRGGKHPPTWRQFLQLAMAKIGTRQVSHIRSAISAGDYLTACEWLKSRLGPRWAQVLREEFQDPAYSPNEFHKALYDLDIRTVITPNFDKIYDTFAAGESSGTCVVKTYEDRDISELLRINQALILKYHGTIDKPASMIFTRREYAEARVTHAGFYRLLNALIMTHTFLFVGCGTSDPDLQLLLEQYTFEQTGAPPHYIVLPKNVPQDVRDGLKNCYNLETLEYRVRGGMHTELLDSLKVFATQIQSRQQVIATELSW